MIQHGIVLLEEVLGHIAHIKPKISYFSIGEK